MANWITALVFLFIVVLNHAVQHQIEEDVLDANLFQEHAKCEPIIVPTCAGKWYNKTIMPNLLGHTKQEEVGMELSQFMPLIKLNCSADIHLFLCSLYVPMCSVLDRPIPPCRSLCESARLCEDVMRKFNHDWPENLECSKFPEQDKEICFARNTTNGQDGDSSPTITSFLPPGSTAISGGSSGSKKQGGRINPGNKNTHVSSNGPYRNIGFVCPVQLKTPPGMGYQLNVGGKVMKGFWYLVVF